MLSEQGDNHDHSVVTTGNGQSQSCHSGFFSFFHYLLCIAFALTTTSPHCADSCPQLPPHLTVPADHATPDQPGPQGALSAWGGNSGHGHSRCPKSPVSQTHLPPRRGCPVTSEGRRQEQCPRGTPPFLVCSWGQQGGGVTRHQPSRQVNGVTTCPCAEHPSPWSLSQQSRGRPGQEHSHSTPITVGPEFYP